jgi:hypothetical protein
MNSDYCKSPDLTIQKRIQIVHTSGMAAAYGTYFDHLAFDQFNVLVVREETGISHAVVVVYAEVIFLWFR